MIILITIKEFNEKTRHHEIIVSHGICSVTGKNIVLPNESITYYKMNCGAYTHEVHGLVMN